MTISAETQKLVEMLSLPEYGYWNVHALEDGTIVANHRLMYTTALMVDLGEHGYGQRYCYPTRALAEEACLGMTSGDQCPLPGFIASRGTEAYAPEDAHETYRQQWTKQTSQPSEKNKTSP